GPGPGDHEDGQDGRAFGAVGAGGHEAHVPAHVANGAPRLSRAELLAPFADRLPSAQSCADVEHTVVDVQLVNRIGATVIGPPCVLDDEATELRVVGRADEQLRGSARRHKPGHLSAPVWKTETE